MPKRAGFVTPNTNEFDFIFMECGMTRSGNCTDAEIVRHNKRIPMFIRRGIAPDQAEQMAWRCVERDADKDDRHYCCECKWLQQDGGCFMHKRGQLPNTSARFQPIKDVLMRCGAFAWQVPA